MHASVKREYYVCAGEELTGTLNPNLIHPQPPPPLHPPPVQTRPTFGTGGAPFGARAAGSTASGRNCGFGAPGSGRVRYGSGTPVCTTRDGAGQVDRLVVLKPVSGPLSALNGPDLLAEPAVAPGGAAAPMSYVVSSTCFDGSAGGSLRTLRHRSEAGGGALGWRQGGVGRSGSAECRPVGSDMPGSAGISSPDCRLAAMIVAKPIRAQRNSTGFTCECCPYLTRSQKKPRLAARSDVATMGRVSCTPPPAGSLQLRA